MLKTTGEQKNTLNSEIVISLERNSSLTISFIAQNLRNTRTKFPYNQIDHHDKGNTFNPFSLVSLYIKRKCLKRAP